MSRFPALLAVVALTGCMGGEFTLQEQPKDTAVADPEEDEDLDDVDPTDLGDDDDDDEDIEEDLGDDDDDDDDLLEDTGLDDTGTPPVLADPIVFDVPGEILWDVPVGVTEILVEAWGAGGAGGNQIGAEGGGGAWLQATVSVTEGETLVVQVAEGGLDRGDGGGASWLFRGTETLVVAAGGGGGGSDGCSGCKSGGAGGAGGAAIGETGQALLVGFNGYCDLATGGFGGNQSAGGLGGYTAGYASYPCEGESGDAGRGGMASGTYGNCESGNGATGWRSGGGQGNGGGGAGGAGWYGGGGAGFIWTYCSGGGGGGSSWVTPNATDVTLVGGQSANPGKTGAGQGGLMLEPGHDGLVTIIPL